MEFWSSADIPVMIEVISKVVRIETRRGYAMNRKIIPWYSYSCSSSTTVRAAAADHDTRTINATESIDTFLIHCCVSWIALCLYHILVAFTKYLVAAAAVAGTDLDTLEASARQCSYSLFVLLLGTYFIYLFFVRKNPSSCDCTEIRTHTPQRHRSFEVTN